MKKEFTVEPSTEWGVGTGPNGTGRCKKVSGHYVIAPNGRKARAFSGENSEIKAVEWAAFCNENFLSFAAYQ